MKRCLKFILVLAVILTFSGCSFWKGSNQTPSLTETQNKSSWWANLYNFTQFKNETNKPLFSICRTSVVEADDGGYMVAGNLRKVEDYEKADIFLLKLNPKGMGVWIKTFSNNFCNSSPLLRKIKDGYILVFETSDFPNGNEKCIVMKFDKDFNISWERLIETDLLLFSLRLTKLAI